MIKLENIIESQGTSPCENSFKCIMCKQSCKSETVLKPHTARKHLTKTSTHRSEIKLIQQSPSSDKAEEANKNKTPTLKAEEIFSNVNIGLLNLIVKPKVIWMNTSRRDIKLMSLLCSPTQLKKHSVQIACFKPAVYSIQ